MQSKNVIVDELSVRVVRIGVTGNSYTLGTATGFIVNHKGRLYLVTNWHVLSGRRPIDNQPMNKMGILPDKLILEFINKDLNSGGSLEIDLNDKDGKPRWVQHPNGRDVDVAIIKLESKSLDSVQSLNVSELAETDLRPTIGSMVTIIGYPFGNSTTNGTGFPFPVWKTGHIASEPMLPYNGKPSILIDATTRPGMSGSPVFIRATGPYNLLSRNEMVIQPEVIVKFIGIYSGRMSIQNGDDSALSSELGLVWSPNTIFDIFSNLHIDE